jgi:hypothetical protein
VSPKFSEMTKVCVRYESGPLEGYVIEIKDDGGRWIYKVSHPDTDKPGGSWDNWAPEEWLEEVK